VRHASNFLMVAASRSATGHPLFVAGPQIGYYYPGLTLEMDLHGPGIDARGAAIPGGPGDILIGRGSGFAWSLTSAGSDTNDEFAETLCGGSKLKYMYKGKCLKMGTINAGTIAKSATQPAQVVIFHTTVHGPVTGYATTTAGKQVAISFDRSSHGKDVLWQLAFKALSDGQVTSPQTFIKALASSPFTFNVPYADSKNIAYYSAGLLPIRNPHVDPRLLTNGNGKYDWQGFLPANKHPQVVNPPAGFLTNWNNKPAPGFGPADDQWDFGMTHRVQLLNAGIAAQHTHTLASVVGAMNNAATEDLRTFDLLPLIDQVLNSAPAPDPQDAAMLAALDAWRASGGNRIDANLDGFYDQGPGPAIMDALYQPLADDALTPVLGPALNSELSSLDGADSNTGSGFENGRLWILQKDLSQLLGKHVQTPYKTRFCGSGTLATCRTQLWAAFDKVGNTLAAAQGPDVALWQANATVQRISFAPGVLSDTIRYTNRPSGIQQAISFDGP
jgi:acyl-homoserine lactone acylase PvdQ